MDRVYLFEIKIRNSNYKNNIEIINDGDFILDTGGGVKNMIQYFKQDDFLDFYKDRSVFLFVF